MQNDAISRNALLKQIDELLDLAYENQVHYSLCTIAQYIKEAPALDVEPVVHAEWSRDAWRDMRCSNCKTRIPYKHCYCEEDDSEWDEEIAQTPWCMYCGARMDGEADVD